MTSPFDWASDRSPSVVLQDKTLTNTHRRSVQSMKAIERARREGREPGITGYGRHYPEKRGSQK